MVGLPCLVSQCAKLHIVGSQFSGSYSSQTGDSIQPTPTYFFNPLTLELNPLAQHCLPRFFTGILIFKELTARDVFISRSALKG
jgi:hypothetical protein